MRANGVYDFRKGVLRGTHPSTMRARALARAGAQSALSWGDAAVGVGAMIAAFFATRWAVRRARARAKVGASGDAFGDYLLGVDIAAG